MKTKLPHSTALMLITSLFFLLQHPARSQDSGTIPADEFKLQYQIQGEGMPAIVVGSALYYPRTFSAELKKQIKFVFLDHRGFAPSPGPVDQTAFALDKILTDIENARQQLDLAKIMIIGHSGHSYMALEYAKKYPENVTHVVMIGIAPKLDAANQDMIQQNWEESVDPERKKVMEENLLRLSDEKIAQMPPGKASIQSYIRNAPRIWYDPHFDSTPLWEGVEMNMSMFNYMWGEVFRDIDITVGLDEMKIPVFLALGRYDYLVAPPMAWDPLRPKFHDLTVRVFERSGHTPQLEQPQLFDQELLEWIRSGSE